MANSDKNAPALTWRDEYNDDIPTKVNRVFVNLLISLISFVLLGTSFKYINQGYFTSVFVYCLPMLMNALGFTPKDKWRFGIRMANVVLLSISILICVLGLLSVFLIVTEGEHIRIMVQEDYVVFAGYSFPAIILWFLAGGNLLFSAVDNGASLSKAEKVMNEYPDKVAATATRSVD